MAKAILVERQTKPATTKTGKDGKVHKIGAKDFTTIGLLPRSAEEGKDSLKTRFADYKGQELMAFETSMRKDLADAFIKDMAGKIVSGEYVFKSARMNNISGAISANFKRAGIRVIGTTTKEQALAALGITQEALDMAIELSKGESAKAA